MEENRQRRSMVGGGPPTPPQRPNRTLPNVGEGAAPPPARRPVQPQDNQSGVNSASFSIPTGVPIQGSVRESPPGFDYNKQEVPQQKPSVAPQPTQVQTPPPVPPTPTVVPNQMQAGPVPTPNTYNSSNVLKQGNTFEESTANVQKAFNGDSEKSSLFGGYDDFFTKYKLYILVGGAAFLIIAIGIMVLVLFGGNKDKSKEEEDKPAFLEELEQEQATPKFAYNSDERERLRVAGYNGEEIDAFEAQEASVDKVISDLQEARYKQKEEELKPLFSGKSKKYKALEKNTWVGGKKINIKAEDSISKVGTKVYNLDYEKIPSHGFQLYIKLMLEKNSDPIFMSVSSERYKSLKDKGNIVVSIDYEVLTSGIVIINSIREVNPDK